MKPNVLALAAGLLLLPAVPSTFAAQVTLTGDDGLTTLTFTCRDTASRLSEADALRVVQDYALRYARAAIVMRDTVTVRRVTSLYHTKNWSALEQLVIHQACATRVLAVQSLPFPAPGAKIPTLQLTPLAGGMPLALSDYTGRRVVIEFWGTWCGPCVRQLPRLDSLAREFGDRVTVIAVAYNDTQERVAALLKRTPTRWLVHTIDADSSVSKAFEIYAAPVAFVIDEDGRIMVSATNPYNRMELDEFVSFYRRTNGARQ